MPLSANGTAYDLTGQSNDPVIVLIHGLGVNRQMWRDYVPVLAERYRVLTYDLLSHGESSAAPIKPSLKLFADQLDNLLDELQINQCVVIGFSLGGMINRRFAMDYPHRLSALVILNSPHERDPEEQRIIEKRVADTAEGGPRGTLEASLARWFTPEFRSARPNVITEVGDWILSNDPVTYTQCREVLAKGVLDLIRPQPPITSPTLVMTCENDSGSTPSMSYAIASEIASAQTVIIPHLQHLGPMENPRAFIDSIERFLNGLCNPA